MLGDDFGLLVDDRRLVAFECLGDAPVNVLPPAAQQQIMRRVLYQGMLEGVADLGRLPAAEDELGLLQFLQRRVEFGGRNIGHRGQQALGETAPDAGADLGDFADRRQAIEARRQTVLQGRRHREFGDRALQHIAMPGVLDETALDHHGGQFLDEQRHPVGLGDDLPHQLVGQRFAAGHLVGHGRDIATAQARQAKRGGMAEAGPRRLILQTMGNQQKHPPTRGLGGQTIEHFLGRGIDPMGVLEDQQDRARARQPGQLIGEHLGGLDFLFARGHPRSRIAVAGLDRQQWRQHAGGARYIGGSQREDGLQLAEFGLVVVAANNAGRALELLNNRVERRVGVIGRDLRPKAPAFIRRVLFLHSALLMGWHARRAWSPQVAQARGAHLRACLLSGPSVA